MQRRGHRRLARVLKTLIFLLYGAILPPEVVLGRRVTLVHKGLGVVVHPKTVIEDDVTICHGVTVGAGSQSPTDDFYVTLSSKSFIGTGALLLPREGEGLRVGRGSVVGAKAFVREDVPDGWKAIAPESLPVKPVSRSKFPRP